MPSAERNPEDLLPLTPAVFNILLALVDGEKHGYHLMQDVTAQTGGKPRLGPGTLYGSIKRMLADHLIEETERSDPARTDVRRRYYRLTVFGRAVAAEEAGRLAELVRRAHRHRLIPDPLTP